jgi:mono/diheme cytochrome c family protein
MYRTQKYFLIAWLTLIFFGVMAIKMLPSSVIPAQQEAPTPTPPVSMPPMQESWLLINLPPNATQLERGEEVYRLVCKACHGDKGQGLTDEWRSTWAPEDQNCWKSKCHAANHPPDGFSMPPTVPAVVGTRAMARFYTGLDLQKYIAQYMPWYSPGRLSEEQSWQVTAYVLRLNSIDPGSQLDAATAAQIRLGGNPPPAPAPSSLLNSSLLLIAIPLVVLLAVLFGFILYRKRTIKE